MALSKRLIIRAAKQGVLTVSDDRGRVRAQQDAANGALWFSSRNRAVRHDDTLYAR